MILRARSRLNQPQHRSTRNAILVVLVMSVAMFGLVAVSSAPGVPGPEPAAADHCDGLSTEPYPPPYDWTNPQASCPLTHLLETTAPPDTTERSLASCE